MPLTSKIAAGELRHRIAIVQPSGQQDSMGGASLANTSPVVTVWASIQALTGREMLAASAFISTVTHRITIRFRPDVKILAKDQVLFEGRRFQVEAVMDPDAFGKALHMLCVEINDSQT